MCADESFSFWNTHIVPSICVPSLPKWGLSVLFVKCMFVMIICDQITLIAPVQDEINVCNMLAYSQTLNWLYWSLMSCSSGNMPYSNYMNLLGLMVWCGLTTFMDIIPFRSYTLSAYKLDVLYCLKIHFVAKLWSEKGPLAIFEGRNWYKCLWNWSGKTHLFHIVCLEKCRKYWQFAI